MRRSVLSERLLLTLLLAILLTFVLVVSATAQEKVRLRLWTLAGEPQLSITEKLVQKFMEKHPNIVVEVQPCGNWAELHQKCLAAIAAGDPPDIRRAKPYQMADYAARGVLLPLNQFIERDNVDLTRYPDVVIKYENSYKGQLIVMPWYSSMPVLYYNLDLFEEAGLGTAPPETWDDTVAYAKKLTNPAKRQWGYIPGNYTAATEEKVYGLLPLIWQAGGDFFNEDLTKTLINSDAGVTALQYYTDMILTHKVTPPPDRIDPAAIRNGRVGMWIDGQWNIPVFAKEAPDLNYMTSMWPKHPQTGKRTALSMAGGLSIFKDTKHPEEAWELVKFLTEPENELEWCVGAGMIPSSVMGRGKPPYDVPPYQAHVENYTTDVGVRPIIPRLEEMAAIIGKEIEATYYGQKSPKQALDDAAAVVNRILDEIE